MAVARSRTLEITVISGDNIYMDQNPVTENAYVVVRGESIHCCTTSLGHPSWKEKLLLDMPMHAKSITFEVQCKSSKGAVRSVGVARIAVSEILGEEGEKCDLQEFSYRLRNWEGRRNGVINFSVRAKKTPEEEEGEDHKRMMLSSSVIKPMGVQVDHRRHHHHEVNYGNNNEVVTGIPAVWWNNYYYPCKV